jgi:dipeptidyl aminopeptidase/acylaminoacyl peptidase
VPGIDERMTQELRRLEPPADPSGAYERVVAKRERRRIIRRAQHGVLAFVVVMGTVAGVFGLNRVFRAGTDAIVPGETVENGLIAYTVNGPDGQIQIFTREADGTNPRAITDPPAGETYDVDPAWSPDGSTIAFARSNARGISVFVVDADGRNQRELTDPSLSAQEPEWSPDGSMIAFSTGCDGIMVMRANGTGVRSVVPSDGNDCPVSPTWSADGTSLVFQNDGELFVVGVDGTDLRNLTKTFEAYEANPAWSPDGDRIAFVRAVDGDGSSEIWTMSPTGADLTLVAGGELSPLFSAVWSPDGQYLLIEHDEAVFRARPDGSDFRRLFAGFEPAWQPLPGGTNKMTATPTPVTSPHPEAGLDIGLRFRLCDVSRMGGIDFLGDGTLGSAWTGIPVRDGGTCPKLALPAEGYGVAVDFTGDGTADDWSRTIDYCIACGPLDATDLNGDGTEELIVVGQLWSVPDYGVYVVTGSPADGSARLERVRVAAPGHPEAGYEPGAFLTLSAGGDAGISDYISCEGYPDSPVLTQVNSFHPPDGPGSETRTVSITRFVFESDGPARVVGAETFEQPTDQPVPYANQGGKACGVDFNPWG